MIVVDSNILLGACRSRNGASFIVLQGMLTGEVSFAASPALILEYEDVLKRPGLLGEPPALSVQQVDTILDALCARAVPALPWFRFRPFLDDPKDDLVIECALAAGTRTIVTNDKDFRLAILPAFGLKAIHAGGFISQLKQERKSK